MYQKRDNETDFEYKIRICLMKINREIDLDWVEIVDLLGLDCSGDHLRKLSYAYKEYSDYINNKKIINIVDEDVLTELEKKKIELGIIRKQIQTVNIKYNKMIRDEARNQLLYEDLKNSIVAVQPPKFDILPIQNNKREYLLGLSDIHFGKKFTSLNNEYSVDILKDRMELLLNETIEICKKENIEHLHILNDADNIEGILRQSALMSIEMGSVDMTINFSRMMVEWLNRLSQYVKITYHHIISSNHTQNRPLGSQRNDFPLEDMERIIAVYIHDMLINNERIETPLYDNDFAKIELCGYKIFASHGHQYKSINKNIIKDLFFKHKELFDFAIFGHLHHGETIEIGESDSSNIEVIFLPSVMGSDEYSDSLLVGSKAGARLLVFEEGKGKRIDYSILLN